MYKEAVVISALMKVYSIPYHDRVLINVVLVSQSCTDSLQIEPGLSTEMFAASSDVVCNFTSTEVEEDVVVIEQGLIAINEEAAVHIKQEEIAGDISFPNIKSEPDKVGYVCVCLLLVTFLPLSRYVSWFYDISISGQLKQLQI
jgi:hypothetical protein